MKKLLMGNEAIALGAIRAGVQFVSGYPGTPSTEILETVVKHNTKQEIYVEWSVNEKVALEVAAGAAYTGARAMVTMKQVGLNVASDPLMSLNYVGIKGGLVIVVADDPGPISSQTEQDTRHFGIYAKLVVFDPSSPEEAYCMTADAFALSEKIRRPVILRPTTRICHGYATVSLLPDLPREKPEGFIKDAARWVIFPSLSYRNHIEIETMLERLQKDFAESPYNALTEYGTAPVKGVVCSGVSAAYTEEAMQHLDADIRLLKLSTIPLPEMLALRFLHGLDSVLVIEELDPVIERYLLQLCGKLGLDVEIMGKLSGDMPVAGEYTVFRIAQTLRKFLFIPLLHEPVFPETELPVRPPVLCAGCPHRSSFFAVKRATKGMQAVFSGDIGCYTLGNAMPLNMVDTCLCMGAGITIAQGLQRIEPDNLHFAFIGDSTFFHTGIPGIVNAVYNETDLIVVILDNYTTAMTGNQPHPGTGKTALGNPAPKLDIQRIVESLGVASVQRVNVFDYPAAKAAVTEAIRQKGVRVILFEGACIAIQKRNAKAEVQPEVCTGCKACITRLGCPAISLDEKKAIIDETLCTGCGLCVQVCKYGSIGVREADHVEND